MKKWLMLLVVLACIAAGFLIYSLYPRHENTPGFVPIERGRTTEDAEEETILIARGDWGYPPFEYLNDAGEPEGFNIDILTRISEIMNLHIRIDLGPWDEVRNDIEEGKIDLLAGMYRTEERDRQVDFSIPHFITSYGVFVEKGSHITSIEKLEGKRILVQTGDLAHDYLVENNIGDELIELREWQAIFPALLESKGDCAVMGMVQGMRLLREEGYDRIQVLSQPLVQRPYCIAVAEGDSSLLATINEGLNLLKISGEYDEIYEKWFGVYREPSPVSSSAVRLLAAGVLLLSLILLFSLFWSYTLRRRVRARTKELRSAMRDLQRANETKNRFLAGVSHELRTPLHGIMGMTRLLRKMKLDAEQKDILQLLERASNQLHRVISDLIDTSRLDSGKFSIHMDTFMLDELEEWLEPVLKESAEEEGLAFSFSTRPKGVSVISDRERVAQVITNLADNAIKNTTEGKVEVRLEYHTRHESLELVVTDTGKGIPKEKQDEIFNPFVQNKLQTYKKESGMGLGLSITRSLINLLGGTIDLESTEGKGSVFSVTIPMKVSQPGASTKVTEESAAPPDTVSAAPSAPSEEEAASEGKRVLIAEDEAINRLYLARLFTSHGWNTTEAANGEEALDFSLRNSYDLILMDISMPKLDGLEATRRLRIFEKQHGRARNPVIALTAHAQENNREECLHAGIDGFVSKPFREHSLWKEIGRVCKIR